MFNSWYFKSSTAFSKKLFKIDKISSSLDMTPTLSIRLTFSPFDNFCVKCKFAVTAIGFYSDFEKLFA